MFVCVFSSRGIDHPSRVGRADCSILEHDIDCEDLVEDLKGYLLEEIEHRPIVIVRKRVYRKAQIVR